jgi:hypothetical protein
MDYFLTHTYTNQMHNDPILHHAVQTMENKQVKIHIKFDVYGSVHCKRIFKCNQQDATLHNLFISVKCSTCFRRFLRPSSGALTVYTASGTFSSLYCYLPLSWKRWNSWVPSQLASRSNCSSSQAVCKPVLHVPSLCVQWKTPDYGHRNCPKHVEFHCKINLRDWCI